MLRNPYSVYIAVFGAALCIYQLGWSEIYPSLSYDFLSFFGVTFLSAFLLSWLVQPVIEQTRDYVPGRLPRYTVLFVIATFVGEIVLARGIPLLLVAEGSNFYKIEATATHLHAFIFWSVFSTLRFADFMYSRRIHYLLEAVLPVIFYVLLVYRGPALMCVVSWVFVYIISQGGLRIKQALLAAVGLLLIFYANGIMGDVRSPGQENAGVPSAAFRNSGIPHTYFWTFLYTTAPIANFQLSVNSMTRQEGTVGEFIASELLPDIISKRILPLLNPRIVSAQTNLASRDLLYSWEQPQISVGLNISTMFGRSYGFFGWIGPTVLFLMLTSFIMVYLLLIIRSPYRVPCLALLNTLVVFCLFNNMMVSAAMLPQLLFPLLLPPWGHRQVSDVNSSTG